MAKSLDRRRILNVTLPALVLGFIATLVVFTVFFGEDRNLAITPADTPAVDAGAASQDADLGATVAINDPAPPPTEAPSTSATTEVGRVDPPAAPESLAPQMPLLGVGTPNEDVGSVSNAGSALLVPLDNAGLAIASDALHLWQGRRIEAGTRNNPTDEAVTIPGTPEAGDYFGASISSGDFNGDGHPDTAIGAPGEEIAGVVGTGMVHVLMGGPLGILDGPHLTVDQNSPGVPDSNENGDAWGRTLLVVDYDGDGYDDLVVGAPGESVGAKAQAGAVTVLFGTAQGLVTDGALLVHLDNMSATDADGELGLPGAAAGDEFGTAMAAVQGRLVIGVPNRRVDGTSKAGAVYVVPHSGPAWELTQRVGSLGGQPDDADLVGLAVAAEGNWIAIGVPGENTSGTLSGGIVHLVEMVQDSPTVRHTLSQDDLAAGSDEDAATQDLRTEDFDYFGASVAIHATADGVMSVVVGSPFETVGEAVDAGSIHILQLDSVSGEIISISGFSQDDEPVPGFAQAGDTMGRELDYRSDGTLVVGVSGQAVTTPSSAGEEPSTVSDAGAVLVRSPEGQWQLLRQGLEGLPGLAESGDNFGFALG